MINSKKEISNLKKTVHNRYKGRGNCWVKLPFESEAFTKVKEFLNGKPGAETAQYFNHIEREGFGWMRFHKADFIENSLFTIFEVRVKGSKIDQEEYRITLLDDLVKDLPLLGNTPLKLQLETTTKVAKTFNQKKKQEVVEKEEEIAIIEETINNIKEKELTTPSKQELKEWVAFLSASGLLQEDCE